MEQPNPIPAPSKPDLDDLIFTGEIRRISDR